MPESETMTYGEAARQWIDGMAFGQIRHDAIGAPVMVKATPENERAGVIVYALLHIGDQLERIANALETQP